MSSWGCLNLNCKLLRTEPPFFWSTEPVFTALWNLSKSRHVISSNLVALAPNFRTFSREKLAFLLKSWFLFFFFFFPHSSALMLCDIWNTSCACAVLPLLDKQQAVPFYSSTSFPEEADVECFPREPILLLCNYGTLMLFLFSFCHGMCVIRSFWSLQRGVTVSQSSSSGAGFLL